MRPALSVPHRRIRIMSTAPVWQSSDAELLAELGALETQMHSTWAKMLSVVAEIDSRTMAPELGYRSTAELVRAIARIPRSEARARVNSAADVLPSRGIGGAPVEPNLPTTAAAVADAAIGAADVAVIRSVLARIPPHLGQDTRAEVEAELARHARTLDDGQLAILGRRILAYLDQDGRRPNDTPETAQRALNDGELPTEGGERPQVVVTVSLPVLQGRIGTARLAFGGPINADAARRIACDSGVIPVVLGSRGEPLDIGRASRTVPAALRRAVVLRDGGCAFPGCSVPARWCDIHHIVHWSITGRPASATALHSVAVTTGSSTILTGESIWPTVSQNSIHHPGLAAHHAPTPSTPLLATSASVSSGRVLRSQPPSWAGFPHHSRSLARLHASKRRWGATLSRWAGWQGGRMAETVEDCATGEDFTDAVFADEEWEGRSFVDCRFTDADLRGLRTRSCRFTNCDFTHADLGASQHRASAFHTCTFQRTMLAESVLVSCSLMGSTINDCRLRPWTLREVDLRLTALGHADLREVVLAGLRLTEANLVQADLRGADLTGADLTGARMLGARLENADLRGARLDADALVQAHLSGARIDVDTAIRYAAANGLRVDPDEGR